jgi:hypothetical protein
VIGEGTMKSVTYATMCPRLGVEARAAETTETRFPQGIRWLWWRCLACGGWHLCVDHQHRPTEVRTHHHHDSLVPASA